MTDTKELLEIVKQRRCNYELVRRQLEDMGNTAKPLKKMIGSPDTEKSTDKRLISVGAALIALPDPFVFTDALGTGLVVAGLMYRKMRKPAVVDVYKEMRRITAELKKTK